MQLKGIEIRTLNDIENDYTTIIIDSSIYEYNMSMNKDEELTITLTRKKELK